MRKAIGATAIFLLTGSTHVFAQIATPGELAPPLQYQTSIDSAFTPDSYKNKLLVIDFWATWCAPCVASAPHISELAQQYKSSAAFVAMSNEKQETVTAYLKKAGKTFKTYHLLDSTRKTMENYGVTGIPHCAVIDQRGILRWTGHSAALTTAILDTALSRKWNPALDHVQLEQEAEARQKASFVNENTVWAFSIANTADSTAPVTSSSAVSNGWTSEMEVKNASLASILSSVTGFTTDRIETNKPALIAGRYDLTYKAAQPSDIVIQRLNKQLLSGKASANSLLTGLSNAFGFIATLEKKQKKYYSLIVTDDALLAKYKSAYTDRSGSSFKPPASLTFSGYSLTAVAGSLNGIMGATVLNSQAETGVTYDIELDIRSTETRVASLKKYGLALKEETGKLDTLIITFAD